MTEKRMMVAYVIVQREGKSFWNRIGVAFTNRDGSINVKLDAVPVSGELQLRDYVPQSDQPYRRGNSDSETVGRSYRSEPDREDDVPF